LIKGSHISIEMLSTFMKSLFSYVLTRISHQLSDVRYSRPFRNFLPPFSDNPAAPSALQTGNDRSFSVSFLVK